jgi:nicotinate dehydrogenase subunit B
MSTPVRPGLSRRQFGTAFGVLLATFTFPAECLRAEIVEGAAPDSFAKNRRLDGWIRIGSDGVITVFTGKAELGQGIHTALAQIAAEELDIVLSHIHMIGPDTRRGPDEGYTYGSPHYRPDTRPTHSDVEAV